MKRAKKAITMDLLLTKIGNLEQMDLQNPANVPIFEGRLQEVTELLTKFSHYQKAHIPQVRQQYAETAERVERLQDQLLQAKKGALGRFELEEDPPKTTSCTLM